MITFITVIFSILGIMVILILIIELFALALMMIDDTRIGAFILNMLKEKMRK